MAFRINHNIASMNAYRNLARNDMGFSESLERLSSGLRINKAGDDPAGLVVSENMRAQIAGLGQAIENSELATAMVQTAEGALTEVHALLTSMRELAIHAANEGANSAADLAADESEITNALATIDRIAGQTQFGTKKLLDGSNGVTGTVTSGTVTFLSGTGASTAGTYDVVVSTQAEKATFTTGNSAAITGITADETLTITNDDTSVSVTVNLEAGDNRQTIIDKINAYSDDTQVVATADGANNIALTSSAWGTAGDFTVVSSLEATDGTQSGFADGAGNSNDGVDIAGTFNVGATAYQADGVGAILTGRGGSVVEGLRVQTTAAAGTAGTVTVANNSLVFQVGANAGQQVSLAIGNMAASMLGKGLDAASGGSNQFSSLAEISILDAEKAADSLAIIDQAIEEVSGLRGTLGAFQSNTLESGVNNLRVAEENLVAAESTIRDTDMAAEMAVFTRNQIMLQAATAMLAHANSAPQVVLQLMTA
jgi:flagellin